MFNTCFQLTPLLHTTADADVYNNGALNLVGMELKTLLYMYICLHIRIYRCEY